MKKITTLAIILCAFGIHVFAQSTYPAANYATAGDTVYLTQASNYGFNYDTTGAGITWNYAALTGVSQRRLIFRLPTETGFTNAQWHYLYTSAVNLSSTDQQSINLGSFQETNPNDYFLKNSSLLEQNASSYHIAFGSLNLNIKNQYTTPDVQLKFPVAYGNVDSSQASYVTNIPGYYYNKTTISRKNTVAGWGTVITPYGTFSNCLKVLSTVMKIDSIAIDSLAPPVDTTYYRELKWLDASKKYTVLYVKENKIGSSYVTQTVEYLDNKQYFQPIALFAYMPLTPVAGDTVNFQNLSTNGSLYYWNFGDAGSGTNDTSTAYNPQHIFNAAGIYSVTLIAYNGPLSDTIVLPVNIGYTVAPTASFTYSPSMIYAGDSVMFSNTSINSASAKWDFGDTASGINNTSLLTNPGHVYAAAGTYTVRLIATNNVAPDTAYNTLTVLTPLSTGIASNTGQNEIRMYPNPATNTLYICTGFSGDVMITVYNVTGTSMYSLAKNKPDANEIISMDVSGLAGGMYYIRVVTAEKTGEVKLIISSR